MCDDAKPKEEEDAALSGGLTGFVYVHMTIGSNHATLPTHTVYSHCVLYHTTLELTIETLTLYSTFAIIHSPMVQVAHIACL